MRSTFEFVFFAALFSVLLGFTIKTVLPDTAETFGKVSHFSLSALISGVKQNHPPFSPPEVDAASNSKSELPFGMIEVPNLSAKSAVVVRVADDKSEIVFDKNKDNQMPIASITKLMTAFIASDLIAPTATTSVSKNVLQKRGSAQKFLAGSFYDSETLLDALLVESNNDAAWLLSGMTGSTTSFVLQMNKKAELLGLNNTSYGNPVGLDPSSDIKGNLSSAFDVSNLIKVLYKEHPDILEKTTQKEVDIASLTPEPKGVRYVATSTNLLLSEKLPIKIIGGKTGETVQAKKNLALAFTVPDVNGYFISVVLGSDDNFKDTKNIIDAVMAKVSNKNTQ
jgi:D-alanyl-D-alanine carboxypeptidase